MKLCLLFASLIISSEAFHGSLLGVEEFKCSGPSLVATTAVTTKYFEKQHLLMVIDYSAIKLVSTLVCARNNIARSYEVFDDLHKVNLVKQVKKSGLSEYPKTRGIYVKGTFKQAINAIAVGSKINPRSRVLILMDDGDYENAEKVLKVAFEDYKMLNVAVSMFYHNSVLTFCLYNPFAGDAKVRRPEFIQVLEHDKHQLPKQLPNSWQLSRFAIEESSEISAKDWNF